MVDQQLDIFDFATFRPTRHFQPRVTGVWAAAHRARCAGRPIILRGVGLDDVLVTPGGGIVNGVVAVEHWAQEQGLACVRANVPFVVAVDDEAPETVAEQLDALCDPDADIEPTVFIIDFADGLLPRGSSDPAQTALVELILSLLNNPYFVGRGHLLVLVERCGPVDARIETDPRMEIVQLGRPEAPELQVYLDFLVPVLRPEATLADDLTTERLASLAQGLLIDDVTALLDSYSDEPITIDLVVRHKEEVLARRLRGTGAVVLPRSATHAEVIGLPQVTPILGEPDWRLFCGASGVGKTFVARAVAHRLGVPLVRLAQADIAVATLPTVFAALVDLAPCAVLVEDLDDPRWAALSLWLDDIATNPELTVLSTTRRPDRVEGTLRQRFDRVPVTAAGPVEIGELMSRLAARAGLTLRAADATGQLAHVGTEVWPRAAEQVVAQARVHARRDGRTDPTGRDLSLALSDTLVAVDSADELHELLALTHASRRGSLPWVAAQAAGTPAWLPDRVRALLAADDTTLDPARVRARLAELTA